MKKPVLYYKWKRKINKLAIVKYLKLNGWFGRRIRIKTEREELYYAEMREKVKMQTIKHLVKFGMLSKPEATEAVEYFILKHKGKRR